MKRYSTIHRTDLLQFETSRLGDVVMTRLEDGKQVYFQPGEAGSEVISILEESPPDQATNIQFMEYFQ